MKKYKWLAGRIVTGLMLCALLSVMTPVSPVQAEDAVTFPDSNLEAAIRDAIGKPTGDIYPSDLETLQLLDAMNRGISDLTGLEYCVNLVVLFLQDNNITDLSPLQGLTSLANLRLSNNQISDITPLQNLTGLTYLLLRFNQISDISALANLTNLWYLNLYDNDITDISAIQNMTGLTELWLGFNQISNISALQGLTGLTYLYLDGNQISDISALQNLTSLFSLIINRNQISDIYPLVENTGLEQGDSVDLELNPLSTQSVYDYIPQLQARGVTVSYTPPANQPPVANAGGPYQVQVDCEVILDGSASYDPDGTIDSYDWDFGDETSGSGAIVPHTYTTVGVYEVTLTVTDNEGAQSSDTTTVEVSPPPVPPVADAGGPYLTEVNCSVDLDGSASYHPDGTIVSYNWDFGDNTGGTGIIVPHIYTASGIYDVILTVTDSAGLESSNTTMVVVYDPQAGSTKGSGKIWSEPGNLKSDPESEGRARFGFLAKYKDGTIQGKVRFEYRPADMKLKSDDVSWLIIDDNTAQFQGEGTINDEGLYTYRILVKDWKCVPDKPDEFSITIWEGTNTAADPIYEALDAPLIIGDIKVRS